MTPLSLSLVPGSWNREGRSRKVTPKTGSNRRDDYAPTPRRIKSCDSELNEKSRKMQQSF
eukprot:CAMPEP_0184705362 /NCGR_PEP_ID=MMETSP0313-20130426/34090_1 /TAXON_ID=2792 /ORGANISM="Porphyridium aerugineum, Strain SAG 1380-2" /LENGTH=59 /DNA_ID=CAMNT_0027166687 /DNA_START=15 /DNA_END=194 /DNA_ORIENTATION=-